jgi:hypothetical protein
MLVSAKDFQSEKGFWYKKEIFVKALPRLAMLDQLFMP